MITVYARTNPPCPFCDKAKNMLKTKNIVHEVIDIGTDISLEEFKERFPNARTVPVILDADAGMIGGCDDLENYLLSSEVGGMTL